MRLLTVTTLLAFACFLTACSGGDDPEDAAVSSVPTAAAPAASDGVAAIPTPTGPRVPTVVLDPGHGGPEVGAAAHGVVEKESNLDFAFRVERMLAAEGVRVVLTRRDDVRAVPEPGAGEPTFGATRRDLQARIDLANAEDADLFVSIHSNGSPDPSISGVEVWFSPNREFRAVNRLLAETLQARVLGALSNYGYGSVDRGIKDDTCFRLRGDRCFPLFVLGPPRTTTREEIIARGGDPSALGLGPTETAITTRATEMPGVLVELLFISNAADAAILGDEPGRDAIARGVADGLLEVLATIDD